VIPRGPVGLHHGDVKNPDKYGRGGDASSSSSSAGGDAEIPAEGS